jgi:GT2 family glycosyltransferase
MKLALVTPARNEAQFIEQTILSVISQTVLPAKWVIVSDGSTDATESIVQKYLAWAPWMELMRLPAKRERNFGAKVDCFNAGYRRLSDIEYDIIGNLDADISFDETYFEFLLSKFVEDGGLGVAGTPFVENATTYNYAVTNVEHVSGACQMFRRSCFEEIGGYVPVKGGGIDWVAVTTARMKGWRTRTFLEKSCFHHRPMGTGNTSRLKALFKLGGQDFYLGGHPLWQLLRSGYQMARRPYVVGGLLLLLGYVWSFFRRVEKPISAELMQFQRNEQMRRLRSILLRRGC